VRPVIVGVGHAVFQFERLGQLDHVCVRHASIEPCATMGVNTCSETKDPGSRPDGRCSSLRQFPCATTPGLPSAG
jgi:hypothetical protein